MTLSTKALAQKPLQDFATAVVATLKSDGRFIGLLAGGSAITKSADAFSDLDLILVARREIYADILAARRDFAKTLGDLLYAFTGEHVGEPRLLICLYGNPVLHVDLKFVTVEDLDHRVENPIVLWDFDGTVAARLLRGSACWPNRDPEWFEERFWVWLHYAATKLGRGELFEVIEMLTFLRGQVLGPLAMRRAGVDQRGVRRLEAIAPHAATSMAATLGGVSDEECAMALRTVIELYVDFRGDRPPVNCRPENEAQVLAYVDAILGRICGEARACA